MNGAVARQLAKLPKHIQVENSSLFATFRAQGRVPGLHINLTEGVPLCNPSKVRSLLNEDGLFLGKFGLRSTPFGARKERAINLQHIELELEKQLYAFRALFDAPPSHADGHQHIHVLPVIVPVIARLLPRHHVPWIRVPEENADNFKQMEITNPESTWFFRTVSSEATKACPAFVTSGLKRTKAFIGMSLMGSHQTIDGISDCLSRVSSTEDTVEFMAHPGFPLLASSTDDGGCGDSGGPDAFSCSSDREHEMQLLCSDELRNLLIGTNFHLSSFSDLNPF
ncbi:YdjC (Bacterial) [Fasciola hepatica]|uniref:Carbohydrate deacetylase n=1 Tax=Fasciola hepatica TaxID=6192 RepID=A0A4E0RU93_FASHE|nr:YdjC (Bacterial) [Fasciola hepatica]